MTNPKKRLNFKQAEISDNGSGTRKTAWLQPYGHPAKPRFSANYTYQIRNVLPSYIHYNYITKPVSFHKHNLINSYTARKGPK